MSKTALLLGLTTLALGGTTLYLRQEIKVGREQQAQLEQQINGLQERLRTAAMRRPEPREAMSPAPPQTQTVNSSPPAAVAAIRPESGASFPSITRNEGFRNAMERQAQLLKDPEYRAAMKLRQKMGLARAYTDLASALNLQPEEADRFLDLLAEQQLLSREASQAMRIGFDRSNPAAAEELRQQVEQDQARKDTEIAQLIGDSGLQGWKDYQSSLGARSQVRELRTFLEGSTAPLREDQFQPLVNAIAGEQRKQQEEMQRNAASVSSSQPALASGRLVSMATETEVERLERNNQRLHDAAAPHLSSEQLNRFDQMLNQQLVLARANLTMMQAQGAMKGVMAVDPISGSPAGVAVSSSGIIVAP